MEQSEVTFFQIQVQVLHTCAGSGLFSCHSGDNPSGDLDLTQKNAYGYLVGISSSIAPTKLRVKPGDPDNSFLIQKLTNRLKETEGRPMPEYEGGTWIQLSDDKILLVRRWIEQGANRNPTK
jgi:hypothetical protein